MLTQYLKDDLAGAMLHDGRGLRHDQLELLQYVVYIAGRVAALERAIERNNKVRWDMVFAERDAEMREMDRIARKHVFKRTAEESARYAAMMKELDDEIPF